MLVRRRIIWPVNKFAEISIGINFHWIKHNIINKLTLDEIVKQTYFRKYTMEMESFYEKDFSIFSILGL